jgi:hypothetical protein
MEEVYTCGKTGHAMKVISLKILLLVRAPIIGLMGRITKGL